MLTPFTDAGDIDYPGLERLIEWYLANGSDALFAVCQSSEMQFLSLDERVALARFVKDKVAGRVPVIASGHVSETREDQLAELTAIANDWRGWRRSRHQSAGPQAGRRQRPSSTS